MIIRMLDGAARSVSGEIPPIEQRLPDEPLVIKPLDEIGKYGGEIRVPAVDPIQAIVAHAATNHNTISLKAILSLFELLECSLENLKF